MSMSMRPGSLVSSLPRPDELAMLEMTAAERRPNSRLSCQMELTTT